MGTDNHTGMVNGLGVLGWKVGTLDAEAVMFGHPLTLPALPKVLGVKLIGTLAPYSTSTDLVMLITRHLRKRDGDPAAPGGAAGCRSKDAESGGESSDVFVEFFGPSVSQLSVADRSAVSNLCSEYGAIAAYFPIDDTVIKYLAKIGRPEHQVCCTIPRVKGKPLSGTVFLPFHLHDPFHISNIRKLKANFCGCKKEGHFHSKDFLRALQ